MRTIVTIILFTFCMTGLGQIHTSEWETIEPTRYYTDCDTNWRYSAWIEGNNENEYYQRRIQPCGIIQRRTKGLSNIADTHKISTGLCWSDTMRFLTATIRIYDSVEYTTRSALDTLFPDIQDSTIYIYSSGEIKYLN